MLVMNLQPGAAQHSLQHTAAQTQRERESVCVCVCVCMFVSVCVCVCVCVHCCCCQYITAPAAHQTAWRQAVRGHSEVPVSVRHTCRYHRREWQSADGGRIVHCSRRSSSGRDQHNTTKDDTQDGVNACVWCTSHRLLKCVYACACMCACVLVHLVFAVANPHPQAPPPK